MLRANQESSTPSKIIRVRSQTWKHGRIRLFKDLVSTKLSRDVGLESEETVSETLTNITRPDKIYTGELRASG